METLTFRKSLPGIAIAVTKLAISLVCALALAAFIAVSLSYSQVSSENSSENGDEAATVQAGSVSTPVARTLPPVASSSGL